jgi:hypothetical protein
MMMQPQRTAAVHMCCTAVAAERANCTMPGTHALSPAKIQHMINSYRISGVTSL